MVSASRTGVSRLTSRGAGQSKAGSRAASEAVSAAVVTPRRPWPGRWVPADLVVGSGAASAVASGEDAIGDSGVAASATAAGSGPAPVAPAAADMVAGIVVSAVPPTRLADPVVVAMAGATTGVTALGEGAVGMAETAARAHMMTDLAAVATATAILGRLAATWSRSGPAVAGRMVGTTAVAVETTTGPGITTTPGNVVTRAATKTPGSCDATNKTGSCLVVGITFFTVVSLVFPLIRLVSAE